MAKSKNSTKSAVTPVQDQSERKKALDAAMAQIEKQFGQGAVMRLGDQTHIEIETIPTGALRSTDPSLQVRQLLRSTA